MKMHIHKKAGLLGAALFRTAQNLNQPEHPSPGEWTDCGRVTQRGITQPKTRTAQYSARWMNLKNSMLSERSQTHKKYAMWFHWGQVQEQVITELVIGEQLSWVFMCVQGQWGEILPEGGQKRTFWDSDNILPWLLSGYTGVHICQNSFRDIFEIHAFYCM